MPELPEVETTRLGIAPFIEGKTFQHIIIRQPQLRWPVPEQLAALLSAKPLLSVQRRAKYLLLECSNGTLILHLGMSGNLKITTIDQAPGKHDHADFIFTDNTVLRFNDQRRFGAILWTEQPIDQHALLLKLGPEPLSEQFNGDYLYSRAINRQLPIKSLLMDSHIVVGVGNIYANEALFMAGIRPQRAAGDISLAAYQRLAQIIKEVLQQAIRQGGTTLRDFTSPQGKPGYFQQELRVYGRSQQPCPSCRHPISQIKIAQRSSFYCEICQS
jgi:formamidopyrimidine-DNA glycosylase